MTARRFFAGLLPAGFDWRTLFILSGILPVVLLPALRIRGGSLRAQLSVDCF